MVLRQIEYFSDITYIGRRLQYSQPLGPHTQRASRTHHSRSNVHGDGHQLSIISLDRSIGELIQHQATTALCEVGFGRTGRRDGEP